MGVEEDGIIDKLAKRAWMNEMLSAPAVIKCEVAVNYALDDNARMALDDYYSNSRSPAVPTT